MSETARGTSPTSSGRLKSDRQEGQVRLKEPRLPPLSRRRHTTPIRYGLPASPRR